MRGVCVLILGVLVMVGSPAWANDQRDEAKAYFEVARTLYKKGDFAGALDSFKKSYAAAPVPDLLYNIGLCEEKTGDLAHAVESYRAFIAARPDDQAHPELAHHVDELDQSRPADEPKPVVAAPAVIVQAPPPPPKHVPIYKRWYFWTPIAIVVVGGIVGGAVGGYEATHPSHPSLTFQGGMAQ